MRNQSNGNSKKRTSNYGGRSDRNNFSRGRIYGKQRENNFVKKEESNDKDFSKKTSYNKRNNHSASQKGFFKRDTYIKKNDNFRKKASAELDEEKVKRVVPIIKEEKDYSDQVEGRNSVLELLESNKDINKLFVLKGEKHGSIKKILAIAIEKKIVIIEVERKTLDTMAQSENHQGVIAIVPPFNYCEVEDILNYAKEKGQSPFIMILDGIEDPHNLGSIIRTAETAGVHGIVIPKRRACGVNATVHKVSAGAVEYMHIARVNNINDTIKYFKQNDIWICGTDMEAEKYYYNQDLTGPIAIVIGSEGFGMSKLVKENCDFLVKIPMNGKITSLNASVSSGIVMYEAVKQRK